MKALRLGLVILAAVAIAAIVGLCLPRVQPTYETTFYYARYALEEGRNGIDPGVDTTRGLLQSHQFWKRFVAPKLSTSVDRSLVSIQFSMTGRTEGRLTEVKLSIWAPKEVDASVIADALLGGLEEWISKTNPKQEGPYLIHLPAKSISH